MSLCCREPISDRNFISFAGTVIYLKIQTQLLVGYLAKKGIDFQDGSKILLDSIYNGLIDKLVTNLLNIYLIVFSPAQH